jgi:hypothetical protein
MQVPAVAAGFRNRPQQALLSVIRGLRRRSRYAVVSIKRKSCMKRLGIGTEGGLLIQCISNSSSTVRSAICAERSVCEGGNGEWLQSAQRVEELIGGHGAL